MKTIKHISGDILLYFYWVQRQNYSSLHDFAVSFQMRHFSNNETSPVMQNTNHEISKNLLSLAESDGNVYNALSYLNEKNFIFFNESNDNVSDNFINFRVTAFGIDTVEGIERGLEEKKEFNINFNIQVQNDFNVESLLKAELGSIFKLI